MAAVGKYEDATPSVDRISVVELLPVVGLLPVTVLLPVLLLAVTLLLLSIVAIVVRVVPSFVDLVPVTWSKPEVVARGRAAVENEIVAVAGASVETVVVVAVVTVVVVVVATGVVVAVVENIDDSAVEVGADEVFSSRVVRSGPYRGVVVLSGVLVRRRTRSTATLISASLHVSTTTVTIATRPEVDDGNMAARGSAAEYSVE